MSEDLRIPIPHQQTLLEEDLQLFRNAIDTGLYGSLGFRLSRAKSWDQLPKLYQYLEDALKSNEAAIVLKSFFHAIKKNNNDVQFALKPGVVQQFGLVSKYPEFFSALSRCVLYPHVNIPPNVQTRIIHMKHTIKDVFEGLVIFMQLMQILEDAKTKDIIWLIIVSHLIRLHPNIYSSEGPHYWPSHLRNAVAHSQILLVGCMITAYNLTNKGEKNWEMAVEVKVLTKVLFQMFADIRSTRTIIVKASNYGLERVPVVTPLGTQEVKPYVASLERMAANV